MNKKQSFLKMWISTKKRLPPDNSDKYLVKTADNQGPFILSGTTLNSVCNKPNPWYTHYMKIYMED